MQYEHDQHPSLEKSDNSTGFGISFPSSWSPSQKQTHVAVLFDIYMKASYYLRRMVRLEFICISDSSGQWPLRM